MKTGNGNANTENHQADNMASLPEEGPAVGGQAGRKDGIGRRQKKRGWVRIVCLLLVLLLAAGAAAWLYLRWVDGTYETTFYQLASEKITSNVRIAFLSDVHLKEYGPDNAELVEEIRSLKPDLILLGGDLITRQIENYDNMLSLCRQLAEITTVAGIMGNHEDQRIYIMDERDIPTRFEESGVIVLRNEKIAIEIGGNKIELVGLSSSAGGFDEHGAKAFMDTLDPDFQAYRICTAHIPILFPKKIAAYGYEYDLGLSGHTHGGLMRLPFVGGVYSAEEGFFPTYDGGLQLVGGKPLVTSRGLGDSSQKVPRFGNPHELVIIDVGQYYSNEPKG